MLVESCATEQYSCCYSFLIINGSLLLLVVVLFSGAKEKSPEAQSGNEASHEEDPNDIFSRQSQLIRSNSSSSTMVKQTPSMRRSMRPAEYSSQNVNSDSNTINSPSHVSFSIGCYCITLKCFILLTCCSVPPG